MRAFLISVVLVVAWGCGDGDVTTYRPHFGPNAGQKPATRTTGSPAAAPEPSTKPKAEMVERVGDLDYAAYGIPIFPGAKVDEDSTLAFKSKKGGPKEIQVTLESHASVPEIALWYKDQIKASHALSSANLASLDGTTDTGHPVKISIALVDTKSVIAITVGETPKK